MCARTGPWKFPENSQREERHHHAVAPSGMVSSPGGHGGGCAAFQGMNWKLSPARCLQTQQEEEEALEEEEESSLSKTPHHGDVLSPSPEQRLRWVGLGCCWVPTMPGLHRSG